MFLLPGSLGFNSLLSATDVGNYDCSMIMDLQDFLIRARVLKLYRHALRTARRAPSHSRDDLKQTIRAEMEINKGCQDKQQIRYLLSDGLERVKRLDEMLDMQGF